MAGFVLVTTATTISLIVRASVIMSVSLGRVYSVAVLLVITSWLTGLLLLVRRDLELREAGHQVEWPYDITTFSYLALSLLVLICIYAPWS